MDTSFTEEQLGSLFKIVFAPSASDKVMTFITDVPDDLSEDNPDWRERREMTRDWQRHALSMKDELGIEQVHLFYYPSVGKANADLPEHMYECSLEPASLTSIELQEYGTANRLEDILRQTDIIIAATEYSATAPLKIAARRYNFRGTTMPGFTLSMIPALGINYEEVHKIIMQFKRRLDAAVRAVMFFEARGNSYQFNVDLRFRTATPSSGILHESCVVGNLPSGEAYIVPYEGEKENIPSETYGELPVQFDEEIVVYRIELNRAIEVLSEGTFSQKEQLMIDEEPAYGNIAEVGLGILGKFGLTAAGNVLMDEKLGLHIAFGRSEHFGGIISPASFRNPKNVIHIDRVYVPSLQPDITVKKVILYYPDSEEVIMLDGEWVV